MSKTEMLEVVDRIITGLDALGDARGYQKCKLITDTLENAVALRGAIDELREPQEDCRRQQEPEDAMMPEAGGQTGEEEEADVCG